MVPIEGEVREGVGLLGSPSFEIPRTVARDSDLDVRDPDELRRQLRAKNRHNAVTIVLRLLTRWVHLFVLTLLSLGAVEPLPGVGRVVVPAAHVAGLLFTVAYFVIGRAGRRSSPDAGAAGLLDLRPHLLAPRTGLEGALGDVLQGASTAPRSRTSCGGCWASGSVAGSSTTAAS